MENDALAGHFVAFVPTRGPGDADQLEKMVARMGGTVHANPTLKGDRCVCKPGTNGAAVLAKQN